MLLFRFLFLSISLVLVILTDLTVVASMILLFNHDNLFFFFFLLFIYYLFLSCFSGEKIGYISEDDILSPSVTPRKTADPRNDCFCLMAIIYWFTYVIVHLLISYWYYF